MASIRGLTLGVGFGMTHWRLDVNYDLYRLRRRARGLSPIVSKEREGISFQLPIQSQSSQLLAIDCHDSLLNCDSLVVVIVK